MTAFWSLLPVFVFAVLARVFRRWQLWLAYLFFAVFSFFFLWLAAFLTGSEALGIVLVTSLVGFLSPEIWQGTRNAVVNFFSRPQNIKYLLFAGFAVLCLFVPAILGTILFLILTILALKTILDNSLK